MLNMDTKNFKLSPWHVYTCVFIGFWVFSACFNSFLETLVLCILFGFLSDYLNAYMVGERYHDGRCKTTNKVVNNDSIANVDNGTQLIKSQVVAEEIQLKPSCHLLEDDEPVDAPTKPLPPPPDSSSSSSSEEEEEMEDADPSEDDINAKDSDHDGVEINKEGEDLGADLLQSLDEYDKHPVPESVEFLDSNIRYQEEVGFCKTDTSANLPDLQEEASNNDENTSPSQDSSFQILDMGSDSEAVKSNQDDILPESTDILTLTSSREHADMMEMSTKDNIEQIAKEEMSFNETTVQSQAQLAERSNDDSFKQDDIVATNGTDNDAIRQTSKDFVEELMEEALNITTEQQVESDGQSPTEAMAINEDIYEIKNSLQSAIPTTSPKDLMDELLCSVPPPLTSPPEMLSDTEVSALAKNSKEDEEDIEIHGEIEIENKDTEDTNELEKLLSDAQKDESEKHNAFDDNLDEQKKQDIGDQKNEAGEDKGMVGSNIDAERNEDAVIDTLQATPINRKDSSSDYDEDSQASKEAVIDDDDVDEKEIIKRAISSDYEEEPNDDEDDDDVSNDHGKDQEKIEKMGRSVSSEFEEDIKDRREIEASEVSGKNKLIKRDSSSDYDEDHNVVEEKEDSGSDSDSEMDIKPKTLADLDEGDPWTETRKESGNGKVDCSEDIEESNHEDMLQHLDSEDLPAHDDMSHRAVFGDDDDRNDEDVLLLEENEEEAKEREDENRKLSTTIPSLMEENISMTQNLEHKDEYTPNTHGLKSHDEEEEKSKSPSGILDDSSMLLEVETAMEAKEIPEISGDLLGDESVIPAANISKESSLQASEIPSASPLDITETNLAPTTQAVKEESLIDF